MRGREMKRCKVVQDPGKVESLRSKVVGKAKGNFDTSWLLANFRQLGVYDVWAVWLAADEFIIGFETESLRKRIEAKDWDWLRQWFSSIQPWTPGWKAGRRLVEMFAHGMPFKLWSRVNIERLAGLWGDLISIECSLSDIDDPCVCCFLISTERMEKIDELVALTNEDKTVIIRVTESNKILQWVDKMEMSAMAEGIGEGEGCAKSAEWPTGEVPRLLDEAARCWPEEDEGSRERRDNVDQMMAMAWCMDGQKIQCSLTARGRRVRGIMDQLMQIVFTRRTHA